MPPLGRWALVMYYLSPFVRVAGQWLFIVKFPFVKDKVG